MGRHYLESTIEGSFGRRIAAWAQSEGIELYNVKFVPNSVRGWPDRIVLWEGGNVLFIEFKRVGEKPRPLQQFVHETLKRCGFEVLVHDNADECLAEVKAKVLATTRTDKRDGTDCAGGGCPPVSTSGEGEDWDGY